MKTRYLARLIDEISFTGHKMAFVSGPRQCGKTTMARMMLRSRGGAYRNWDDVVFRRQWVKDPQQTLPKANGGPPPLVVFDELHKAKGWKGAIKGVYDTLADPIDFLVVRDGKPWLIVEAKSGRAEPSPNWRRFLPSLAGAFAVQIGASRTDWRTAQIGPRPLVLAGAAAFLAELP